MKRLLGIFSVVTVLTACAGVAQAQTTSSATVTFSVTLAKRAALTITGGPVVFPDVDGDTASTGNALSVTAKSRAAATDTVTLTMYASGALSDGGTPANTIATSNISWAVTGSLSSGGSLSSSSGSPSTLGSWTGSGNRTGTVTFQLAPSWAYAAASYSTTTNFVLTVP